MFLQEKTLLLSRKSIPTKYKAILSTCSIPVCKSVVVLLFAVILSAPPMTQYVLQNIRFLHTMQCVIDIFCSVLKRCNGQCILEHSLKHGRLVLKEHAADKLQSELYSSKQETIFLQGNKKCGKNAMHPLMRLSLIHIFLHNICF